jgi:hypothetical protein
MKGWNVRRTVISTVKKNFMQLDSDLVTEKQEVSEGRCVL